MTKAEAVRQTEQERQLLSLGISAQHAEQLRRISMRLHRWYEKECGIDHGCIERDDDGKVYWHNSMSGRRYSIRDDERGAERRLKTIMSLYPTLAYYLQTDPRGAALYILRLGDVPKGADPGGYYNRGIVVY